MHAVQRKTIKNTPFFLVLMAIALGIGGLP